MKAVDQIDLINTAIRLGDPVVPPVGARVRMIGPGTNVWDFDVGWRGQVQWRVKSVKWAGDVCRCELRCVKRKTKRNPRPAPFGLTVLFPNGNGTFLQIVWLPKDVPPFEDWPRWGQS